jgi:O-antigen ligase
LSDGKKRTAQSFAPLFAGAFLLWPVMGALGGQGYAPLLLLTALMALFFVRPKGVPALVVIMAGLFVLWAMLSELWSPHSGRMISGDLLKGNFSINAGGLKVLGLYITGLLTVAALLHPDESSRPRNRALILGAIFVQAVSVIASGLLSGPIISLVYGSDPMRQNEGVQNLMRNANTLTLLLPAALAVLWHFRGALGKGLSAGLLVLSVLAFGLLGAQTALLCLPAFALAVWIVFQFPKQGYRILIGALAALIASAPILFSVLTNVIERLAPHMPGSFWSRAYSWQATIGHAVEAPLIGHGLAASRTWRDTFATAPDWLARLPEFWKDYPIIPGHPHNMPLQVWAETGFVGAVLASLTLVALAFRMPPPEDFSRPANMAVGGLIAAAACHVLFSYSAWNEGFWASVILAVAAVIVLHRAPEPIRA